MAEFEELEKLNTHEEDINENMNAEPTPEPEPIDYNDASNYPEDPAERSKQLMLRSALKSKLNRCATLFKEELIGYEDRLKECNGGTYSNENLKLLLDEVKLVIGTRRSSNLIKPLYFTGLEFMEKIGCRFGYNISGVKDMMYKNIEVHKCLDEMSLDIDESMYMPAYLRLGLMTAQTLIGVYEMNKIQDTLTNEMNKPIKKEFVDEFKDI